MQTTQANTNHPGRHRPLGWAGARRARLGRAGVGLWVAATVVWLALAGGAWACVPQPLLVVGPVSSGPVGTKVTVNGLNFTEAGAEVRWNGLDGALLASANGPDFSVDITIPEAPDGLYVLVGLVRGRDGSVGETTAAPFQVSSGQGGKSPPASARPPESAQAPTTRSSGLSSPELAVGAVVVFVVGAVAGSALRRRRGGAQVASP